MHIIQFLVGLTFLAVQCRSLPVRENDRQYPAIASQYQQIDQENLRQERQLQQLSRQDRRIPQDYRYQYEPEPSYSAETQYQPSYSDTPNRIITRPRPAKQQATIEQFLKEVTPTTKTTYDPSTYQPAASSGQPQSAAEYFLHPEQQKQPFIQQQRYEFPESAKEAEVPQNVVAYQNALIAHQNAIYEQQRADQLQKQRQDSASKASLYVAQNIQKKPVTRKLVKPKTSSLDEEIDYLTSLQYQQQQIQQQNKVYEAKQSPTVKYQARIPQYSKPELLTTEEEQGQVYQPQIQYTAPIRFAKPSKSPKVQAVQYQPQYQQQDIRYQQLGDTEATKFQQFDPAQYEQYIQYQSQPQVDQPQYQVQTQPQSQPQYSAGPKYLPEQKLVRYPEAVGDKYQQTEIHSEDAQQKYRASLSKLYSADRSKPLGPRQQVKPQYVQEAQQQPRYQAHQYEQPAQQHQVQQQQPQQHQQQPQQHQQQLHQAPQQQQQQQAQPIYQGPTDEEYKQSEFKQSLGLNSSLRILKSGKPVVFIGHEE